jgi:hypothetical protein
LRAGTPTAEFSVTVSSAALVFVTVALNLRVTQAATGPGARPLFVFAVLGASEDITLTVLDESGPKVAVVLRDEWPVTVAVSVTDKFSPWATVKVHDAVVPLAMVPGVAALQVVLDTVPMFPTVEQAGPVKLAAV